MKSLFAKQITWCVDTHQHTANLVDRVVGVCVAYGHQGHLVLVPGVAGWRDAVLVLTAELHK